MRRKIDSSVYPGIRLHHLMVSRLRYVVAKHGCSPKLAARFFKMNLNNAYQVYKALVQQHSPNRWHFTM